MIPLSTRFALARWIVGSTFVLAGIAKWVWPPAASSVDATFVALWPPLGPVWAGLEVALDPTRPTRPGPAHRNLPHTSPHRGVNSAS